MPDEDPQVAPPTTYAPEPKEADQDPLANDDVNDSWGDDHDD